MSAVSTLLPAHSRRNASLPMLLFAMVVVLAAFAQVGLARDGRLPAGMVGYGAALAALVGAGYVIVARFAPHADPLLLPLTTLLNGLGLAMIYRLDLSTSRAAQEGEKYTGLASAPTQLQWTALSIIFFVGTAVLLRDTRVLQRYMYTLGALGLLLLISPAIPGLGREINGSRIWIGVGPFSIQPGEFAKILLIVFFAGYLVNKRQALSLAGKRLKFLRLSGDRDIGLDLPRARDLGPILVAWLLSVGVLVVEKDLGTSLLFFGLFVAMLYIATQRLSWVLIGMLLFLGGAYLGYLLFAHVKLRVDIWLHPWDNGRYENESFQLVQGLYGMAAGGELGTGLGQGKPTIIPLSFSDLIIASFGEELGLTGVMVILLVYALIVQRGLKAAITSRDSFACLFAAGISFVLALQVFVIVGGVTRLIPLTGLTTPFLSQGGSSLLANWILIAILIRISDQARRPAPQSIQDEGMTQVVRVE